MENLEDFENATGSEYNTKIKSEYFNKWVAYLKFSNLDQLGYSSFPNGLTIQYKVENKYPNDLISAADIEKIISTMILE